MFAGPIFHREAITSPRRLRHFIIRSGYIVALFILMYTAGQATFGFQQLRNFGDLARFGGLIFQVFALIQLALVLFFALLFSAGNIAQEKDRRTLILLLMTDLKNRELVLGKLWSSLLMVGVLLAASLPVFVFLQFLGGVMLGQIVWMFLICAATAIAAGSWGSLVGFWREQTFQTLAISVLGVVLFLGVIEAAVLATAGTTTSEWIGLLNPFRALLDVLDPLRNRGELGPVRVESIESVLMMTGLAVVLNGVTIWRLRVWNPSQVVFESTKRKQAVDDASATAQPQASRHIWLNPVLWREIRTRAYGAKGFVIKLAYLALAAFVFMALVLPEESGERVLGMVTHAGFALVGLGILCLMLVNAQAVTAVTSERDMKTLEPLLMTDISAKEFIFGKLGGILYNTKELIAVPLAIVVYLTVSGRVSPENALYLFAGVSLLVVFAAMLGVHYGLSLENSRIAIGHSLGTIFFLFVGIFIFMLLLVEARSSFLLQFQSFVIFIFVGSIVLWWSLTQKNPSAALRLSAALLPFLTFYSITQFLIGGTLGVCLAVTVAYGFTTIAMLIPAISEFDVALGRTTLDQG